MLCMIQKIMIRMIEDNTKRNTSPMYGNMSQEKNQFPPRFDSFRADRRRLVEKLSVAEFLFLLFFCGVQKRTKIVEHLTKDKLILIMIGGSKKRFMSLMRIVRFMI